MRLPSQSARRTPLKFNITPLIDVVFLLIIFFLVASHFVRSEQSRPVELPVAVDGKPDEDTAAHRITVTLDRGGDLYVGGEQISESDLILRIQQLQAAARTEGVEPEVRLRSDRLSTFGPFRRIYEACAAQQIHRIQFAVSGEQP
ncbi:MAG: biopolymer transporter ExbD [Planctomycetaceae bacterium]